MGEKSEREKIAWKVQEIRNSIFIKELAQIADEFQDFILLKGLWYQNKYYGQEDVRLFGDIDLFVCESDFTRFDEVMQNKNFTRVNKDSNISNKFYFYYDVYDNTKLSYDKMNHYVYQKKGYNWITIEVHTYMLPYYQYPLINYEEIYNRRRQVVLHEKLNVNVLDCNDDFIYAACHMCKHFVHAIVAREESEKEKVDIAPEKFVNDLAKMIEVGEIDWNIVLKRVNRWDVVQDVLVACKMVNHFYEGHVPQELINTLKEIAEEDKQRGLYKSLIRDIALANISNVFGKEVFDFVNENQINPYGIERGIKRKDRAQICTEIIRSELGVIYSEWDQEYWYLIYESKKDKHVVLYASVACPLYDVHSVTILLDNEDEMQVTSRNVKFENRKAAEWLKGVTVETNQHNQHIIKVKFDTLKIDPNKTKKLGCQLGLMLLNEEKEVVDRVSLFGSGYYHFYDMGVLNLMD